MNKVVDLEYISQHCVRTFNVYLKGKLIDTVWFTGYTVDEARESLINHDGYSSEIVVRVR